MFDCADTFLNRNQKFKILGVSSWPTVSQSFFKKKEEIIYAKFFNNNTQYKFAVNSFLVTIEILLYDWGQEEFFFF
jgi:hypothetical protein